MAPPPPTSPRTHPSTPSSPSSAPRPKRQCRKGPRPYPGETGTPQAGFEEARSEEEAIVVLTRVDTLSVGKRAVKRKASCLMENAEKESSSEGVSYDVVKDTQEVLIKESPAKTKVDKNHQSRNTKTIQINLRDAKLVRSGRKTHDVETSQVVAAVDEDEQEKKEVIREVRRELSKQTDHTGPAGKILLIPPVHRAGPDRWAVRWHQLMAELQVTAPQALAQILVHTLVCYDLALQ